MDRETINIAKSQLGFIDFIIAPSWEVLSTMLPALKPLNEKIKENRKSWEDLEKVYEDKMVGDRQKLKKELTKVD